MSSRLTEKLTEMAPEVPDAVPVFRLQRPSIEGARAAAVDVLRSLERDGGGREARNRWTERRGRSVLPLAEGARMVVHHASGAVSFTSGLAPSAQPFDVGDDAEGRAEVATRAVERVAERLPLAAWAEAAGNLELERTWRILGAGVDRDRTVSATTMFRAIGAYRVHTADLPVLGPASIALRVTGDGRLDGLQTLLRRPVGEPLDKVRIRGRERAADDLVGQLVTLMGDSRAPLDEVATPRWVRFGYLSTGRRTGQRTLEPVYVTQLDVETEDSQGYVLTVPAGEKVYEPVCRIGQTPTPSTVSRTDDAPSVVATA